MKGSVVTGASPAPQELYRRPQKTQWHCDEGAACFQLH